MGRVLFLDIDGVLNRTGFHPGKPIVGLSSWIETELVVRMSRVVHTIGAEVVMCSDWRIGRELADLRTHLRTAGAAFDLRDATPQLGQQPRWRELEAWRTCHGLALSDIVIVDDAFDMGDLASRHVRTSPLNGFDEDAATAVTLIFA